MKVISTEFRDEEPISWEDLELFLQEGIFEEDFLVLSDTSRPDYIQTARLEDNFVVEIRIYEENQQNFKHLRTFVDVPEDCMDVFKDFYHDIPYDNPYWEDITDEYN